MNSQEDSLSEKRVINAQAADIAIDMVMSRMSAVPEKHASLTAFIKAQCDRIRQKHASSRAARAASPGECRIEFSDRDCKVEQVHKGRSFPDTDLLELLAPQERDDEDDGHSLWNEKFLGQPVVLNEEEAARFNDL